jgi:glycosyltransferase involved in cell wall biosynthesis
MKARLNGGKETLSEDLKVSVIIPARNEETRLPHLLDSLMVQTYKPYEIIVVDDHSSDKTGEIARGYDVKVIDSTELPENWTGKSWAMWNAYQESSGNVLVFFDADVSLSPRALKMLLKTRQSVDGAISVVPYHETTKLFERLSLLPYLLGVFAFTSPFEKTTIRKVFMAPAL